MCFRIGMVGSGGHGLNSPHQASSVFKVRFPKLESLDLGLKLFSELVNPANERRGLCE